MSLEIQPRVLIFLLTSVGLITLPHINNVPIAIFAYFVLLLSWRFIGIWRKSLLPPRLLLVVLTSLGIVLLFAHYPRVVGRDAGTSLFLIGLGLKLLEIKSQRDLYLISYLAFIVASSLFLYSQSIFMVVYILLVCNLLLATLVTINSQEAQPTVALKKSITIILQALPMTIALFILFPRVEAPKWLLFQMEHKAIIGLNDTMEPGSITELSLSPELVFRAKFKGDIPPPEQRYWRGPAYSFTNGIRWLIKNAYYEGFLINQPQFRGKAYSYTLMMEPQEKNWVFALDLSAKPSHDLFQKEDLHLITRRTPTDRSEYNLVSYPEYTTGALTEMERTENLQLNRQVPVKLTALVTQLHGFEQPPEAFVNTVLTYFKTEKFYYTLKPPLLGKNPIEKFLLETRQGFCSHYATAFVYLMRIAHIPARVIGGYQGGKINSVGNFLEVRQADAHAWAEVWLANKGWTRVDPTAAIAPERVLQGVNIEEQLSSQAVNFTARSTTGTNAWLQTAAQLWQSVDYNWQRWVINYDNANQTDFLESLGIMNLGAMLRWLFSIIAAVTTVLAWFLLRHNQLPKDKIVLQYAKFCKQLQKVNCQRADNEGENAFAIRACERFPQYRLQIETITALYTQLRYTKNPSANAFLELKRQIAGFKIALKN